MLSVIVPAKNEQGRIRACLDAVLSQETQYAYEVIVIDNGSSDDAGKIAKSMGVKVFEQVKKGLANAKNMGAEKSSYDNLLFVDVDCLIPKDFVEKVANVFVSSEDIDAFGGPYIYRDGGKVVEYLTNKWLYFYRYSNLIKALFGVVLLQGGNMAVRKKVIGEVGGFDGDLKSIIKPEDLEFCVRATNAGKRLVMFSDLKVESSFRRQMRPSVLGDAMKRAYYALRVLRKKN